MAAIVRLLVVRFRGTEEIRCGVSILFSIFYFISSLGAIDQTPS